MASGSLQFETLIVGAGLLGSSTAYHLALLGAKNIAVIDADLAGRLSSSELNAGGARATWDQSLNVQLSRDSIDFFRAHRELTGYRDCGYLWMYAPEKWQAAQERAKFLKDKHKIHVDVLDVPALQKKTPFIDKTEGLAGATFSPLDGLFNPNLVKNYFRDEARRMGVEFLEGHRVKKVELPSPEKVLVSCELIPPKNETELKEFYEHDPALIQKSSGQSVTITGSRIVNAAGPWAARLAKLIGYETPVYALRRQVSIFDVRGFDMSQYGMMVDTSGVYFHPEATNILGGYADHEEKPGWNLSYDGESFFQEKIWMPLFERSTKFEQLKHLTGWGGLYEVSPDQMGVLGRVEGTKNVFENHGYSGRGAMQSYAAGRGLAELMHAGKFQTLDLSPMNGERFRAGNLLPEGLLI
ncbi:MAG TPA: FAD-binding oxidoreductase [Bdellovibrionota bacterium]|jgi:glycine/D-amino acid oxidase-like deaminating enzyme